MKVRQTATSGNAKSPHSEAGHETPTILPVSSAGLVDIVSGSFGAGHDAAARAIATRLEARGFTTRTWDVVDLLPGHLGRVLRAVYLRQVQTTPATWRWVLELLERHQKLAGLVSRALEPAAPRVLDIASSRPERIIATHPFASQVLGELRASGRLDVPVVTYLTDMSVHRLWVHPSVDLHLAVHELPAEQARRIGAGVTRAVRPAVREAFVPGHPSARASARRAFGLPLDERLVLVTGGSCGIGHLVEAAEDVAASGEALPVVLCGHNKRLLRRIRRSGTAVGLGWIEDMPQLLTAVDAVVQNSGGITSLETIHAGAPILTYRCIAGHGETNADALDRAGLAPWVRDADGLGPALREALSTGGQRPAPSLPSLDLVEELFHTPGARSA
jgi:processive 1,2-diacylglycerol beta-glucosyltransferase